MSLAAYQYCRVRFVGNMRFACGADIHEDFDVSDNTVADARDKQQAEEWAEYIQDSHRKLGLKVPELEIVVHEYDDSKIFCYRYELPFGLLFGESAQTAENKAFQA